MKKIINGRMYNTETAKIVGEWSNGKGYRDFGWCHENLHKKKTGEFFIHGESGPAGKYCHACPTGGYDEGEAIVPLTEEEAREWAEAKLGADEYTEIFGEVDE